MKQRNYLGLKPVKDEGYTYIIGIVDRTLTIRALWTVKLIPTDWVCQFSKVLCCTIWSGLFFGYGVTASLLTAQFKDRV